MDAVDFEMMLPAFGEVGIKLGLRGAGRMDVAVRDRGLYRVLGGQGGSGFCALAELDIHRLASFGSGLSQAGIGSVWIVDHDLAHEIGGETFGQRVQAVELPVRVVRGE